MVQKDRVLWQRQDHAWKMVLTLTEEDNFNALVQEAKLFKIGRVGNS
jgi:hypothetical protein